MSSENLHVPREVLSREGRLLHHAITSLKEELDAVDWYRQRADDTEDEELKQVLLHNMREEMEHAAMVLEWIRRNNKEFEGFLRTYLFTEAPIVEVEHAAEGKETAEEAGRLGGRSGTAAPGSGVDEFTIGSLKGK
ncbi:MAG: ferritin [Rhodospirillales bacterium]|nr:ferritin [Rhodospirillales bacterium]